MSTFFLMAVGVGAGLIAIAVLIFLASYKKVPDNHSAMIINGIKERAVTFTGGFVFPRINTMEIMDISIKTIELDRRGGSSLSCKDNIRADITVSFYMGVNPTIEDVLAVSQAVGASDTKNIDVLRQHFLPKFSEAVKTVGKQFDFEELLGDRDDFNRQIREMLEGSMDGFRLHRVAIDYLEQTPLKEHNDDNILDVDGIRKITERTSNQNVLTHRLQQDEIETKRKREVEKEERILELNRQEEEAKSKTDREISEVRSRETAAAKETSEAMRLKIENARLNTDEEVGKREISLEREIEAARLNNERVLVGERENVSREDQLQKVQTKEKVTLSEIECNKKAEGGNKEVAEIKSERVAVERKIAIEEEQTSDIRNTSEANRQKLVLVTQAEAEAEQNSISRTVSAEADKNAAISESEKIRLLSVAHLDEAGKQAEAKVLMAGANRAELAAPGLADAEVQAASAKAIEEVGMANARVTEVTGIAEAKATSEKAEALSKLNEAGMEFEKMEREFKLREVLSTKQIQADVEISGYQAQVMSAAMKESDIQIVGGSNEFFSHIQNMITKGKGIDAMVKGSDTIGTLAGDYLDGSRSLPEDLTNVLSSLSSGDFANLSVAEFLQTSQGKSILGGLSKLTS